MHPTQSSNMPVQADLHGQGSSPQAAAGEVPVLMRIVDLSQEVPAEPAVTPAAAPEKKKSHFELPAGKLKFSVPPVATLGGLIGVAVVLVLVLLSRGGDEAAKNPTETPKEASQQAPTETLVKQPADAEWAEPAGKAQMARLGLEDAPVDTSGFDSVKEKRAAPYLPKNNSTAGYQPSHTNPQQQTPAAAPTGHEQNRYPQTSTPGPLHLEAKRPDRSASARPPVELKGTIANPNFRARNESQRSRVH
jgi:hypothetical protein